MDVGKNVTQKKRGRGNNLNYNVEAVEENLKWEREKTETLGKKIRILKTEKNIKF